MPRHIRAVASPDRKIPSLAKKESESEYQQVTSKISARGVRGREIYIYLNPSDTLESSQTSNGDDPSSFWIRVEVDMQGNRHWRLRLTADDVLNTGRLKPPPPPPDGG